jgi:hypothetical protein
MRHTTKSHKGPRFHERLFRLKITHDIQCPALNSAGANFACCSLAEQAIELPLGHAITLARTLHQATAIDDRDVALAAPVEALAQPLVGNSHSLGRQVAIEIYSSCHQVTEGQSLPRQNAPSFIDIANMPSTTALSLKVFLRSNHKGMPNLIVSDSDSDDLVDYILSLKQR